MRLTIFSYLVAITVTSPAFAISLYDDMGESFPNGHTIVGSQLGITNQVPAIQFQIDSSLATNHFQVTEYSVRLRKDYQSGVLTEFSLNLDEGGKPGAVIDLFHVVPIGTDVYGMIYSSPSLLMPSVTRGGLYWITARMSQSWDGAFWHHTMRNTGNRTMAFQSPAGTWSVESSWRGPALGIRGVAIPEPTTAAMAGIAAVASLRRRVSR